MKQINQWNRALITGASSGIGAAFAHLLAEAGTDLVVVGRDSERLKKLAEDLPVQVEVIVADLANRHAVARVEERLEYGDRPVDLLVNNAGFGESGDFLEQERNTGTAMVEVNAIAVQRLAHAAAVGMSRRQRGGILNVSSIAGSMVGARAGTYSATKAFVTSLSQSLHAELEPQGIAVTCLCPGLTRTEFHDRGSYDTSKYPEWVWQSSIEVALEGLEAIAKGRAVVVPGLHNKAAMGLSKLSPGLVTRKATKFVTQKD